MEAARVRQAFSYDPSSGDVCWRTDHGKMKTGQPAGTRMKNGRQKIVLDGETTYASRVAFVLMTGDWPPEMVDHINGNPADNRWANLRGATRAQNTANQKKQARQKLLKGVSRAGKKFRARLVKDGREIYLGVFPTATSAHAAYATAARIHHGTFANLGG